VIGEAGQSAIAQAQAVLGDAIARVVLADASTGTDGGESKKSGPLGLVVIIALCIGCYFLFKSMSKHLRRVREEFPAELPPDPMHPDVRTTSDSAGSATRAAPTRETAPPDRPADPGPSD
jgi:hypothetical protein